MNEWTPMPDASLDAWVDAMKAIHAPKILATGAYESPRSQQPSLRYKAYVPNAEWVGTDISAGRNVDVVADLHRIDLDCIGLVRSFDGIYSESTLEHLERPWVAVIAMGKLLKRGGALFLMTHQTFPLHGYPDDFYRFSTRALETMVWDAGLKLVKSTYSYPCRIEPPPEALSNWNPMAEAYLNVCCCAVK